MKQSEAGMSRRSMLRTSLGGIAAGIAAGFPAARGSRAAQAAAAEYGPFRMGFQSYCLRHFTAPEDFVREAARLKLPWVELWRGHLRPDSSEEDIRKMRARLGDAGIRVAAFGVESFTADHAKNEQLFKFGSALGIQILTASPSKDAFGSLEKLVKQYGIGIAIHNHGPEDERWRRPEWILEAVGSLDPRIGACADLGHFIRAGVDPVEAVEMLGSRVLGCHFKDFDAQGRDVIVGTGKLDVVKALRALNKVGFKGPLSLEFEGDKEDPVPKMLQCLSAIRAAVKQL